MPSSDFSCSEVCTPVGENRSCDEVVAAASGIRRRISESRETVYSNSWVP